MRRRIGPYSLALIAVFVAGVVVRLALLATVGVRDDTDQFAGWIHSIATHPIGQAYRRDLTFPPVMVYVFAILAAAEPAFRTVENAADPLVRAVIKTPASLADIGLAAGVWWYLRPQPVFAVAGAAGILLSPAIVDVSAWWGQFESIYVLGGLASFLLLVSGHPRWAGVALGVAVMTKPQALPFIVPIAGWSIGRFGLRETIVAAVIACLSAAALWAPFLPDGGIGRYLGNVDHYQNGVFAILSLRAWNPWWILQVAAGGGFLSDSQPLVGPLTPRAIGIVLFALGELVVFAALVRVPTPARLALGLATSVLIAFITLTTMHERYAYGALVFLLLLIPEVRLRWVWAIASVAITANLIAAFPPPLVAGLVPIGGAVGIAGSIVVTGLGIACLAMLTSVAPQGRRTTPSP